MARARARQRCSRQLSRDVAESFPQARGADLSGGPSEQSAMDRGVAGTGGTSAFPCSEEPGQVPEESLAAKRVEEDAPADGQESCPNREERKAQEVVSGWAWAENVQWQELFRAFAALRQRLETIVH